MDGRMKEMAQMWMGRRTLSAAGVLAYVEGPGVRRTAVDDHFLHATIRPLKSELEEDDYG
jgi:hypothetical protein